MLADCLKAGVGLGVVRVASPLVAKSLIGPRVAPSRPSPSPPGDTSPTPPTFSSLTSRSKSSHPSQSYASKGRPSSPS